MKNAARWPALPLLSAALLSCTDTPLEIERGPVDFRASTSAGSTSDRIVFVSTPDGNAEIYVMDADGSNQTRLTNDPASDQGPSWSPDGGRIAFYSTRDGNAEIYVVDSDGSNLIRLTHDPAGDFQPSWSPDGSRIAFSSLRDASRFDIYVMDADGSNPIRLTTHQLDDLTPTWSPDGTQIAFISERAADGFREVYIMDADGSNVTQVTNDPATVQAPSWSPDGTRIAFASNREGNNEIYTILTDGSNPTRLTNHVSNDFRSSWSPDGTHLAFRSDRGGNPDIYIMEADGSNPTRITTDPAADVQPSWGPSVPLDDEAPVVTNTAAAPNPVAVNGSVDLTAHVDDTGSGDSNIASAEYSLDGGTFVAMAASDGAFDEVAEDGEAGFTAPAQAGIYDLCVRGADAAGNVSDPECIMLVAYDPEGGFVTGGGWIDSPAGAYMADPSLTGKPTFGFVSKYKKGATVPTGNTEFQFQAGSFDFHSSSYEWLVVNQDGTNAQFKGSGTINGELAPNGTEFRFMIWAKDGSPDTFRIRIWYEDGAEVPVYDNGFEQPIGGGSIIVHVK